MNLSGDKRTRSVNWDENEKRLLVDYVKKYISILENVRPDTDTNKKKKVIWQMIEDKLRDNGYSRDAARIKEQWRRLKAYAKRNIMKYRSQIENCDDPASIQEPSIMDYEIWELIPHECSEDDNLSDSNSSLHPKKRKKQNDSDFESDSSWTQLETRLPSQNDNIEIESNNTQMPIINLFTNTLNTEPELSTQQLNEPNIKEELVEDEIQEDVDVDSEHFDNNDMHEEDFQDIEDIQNHETDEIPNSDMLPSESNFTMNLPPLHKIIQEPTEPLDELSINTIGILEPLEKPKDSLENEILILKKKLLEANIERLEAKTKLDFEFHQHKMKLENIIAKKRLENEEKVHKLQIALERRCYKRRMEYMAISMF